MELKVERRELSCMDQVLQQVCNTELTQHVKLPDGMPDIGRVLSAWGQVILRSKQWQDDELTANGGILVWILYVPEDGGKVCCIDSWIPFQIQWDLPEGIPEGNARIQYLTRFVDARSLSPRKILVRCGVGARAEAYVPVVREILEPEGNGEVALLNGTYPLRLVPETGERTFSLDETLTLPDSAGMPEKLIYSRLMPEVTEQRVVNDKLVFRGNGNLHVLYHTGEGILCSEDLELPFSQVIPLEQEYGQDAQADVLLTLTDLETEPDDLGHIRLRCGIAAQYRISDRKTVSVAEDAYSNSWNISQQLEHLELPVILEEKRENLMGEQGIQAEANTAVDISFWPDFPGVRYGDSGVDLEIPGSFQVLYYGTDGNLHCSGARWEGKKHLDADEACALEAVPIPKPAQAAVMPGQIQAKAELPLYMQCMTQQRIPMITAIEMEEKKTPDAGRPSLILRRAGDARLWDIAKESGSTVEDIRKANGLRGEPAPDQMLLIPVV